MPSIVITNVTLLSAPQPNTLQQTGAIVSQGGTNTSQGTVSFISQPSDLTPLQPTPLAVSAISWSGQVVSVTTSANHGLPSSEVLNLTLAGFIPSGYNGTYPCTVTGTNTFTYPLITNPGVETTLGTWINATVAGIFNKVQTFYAQGSAVGIYILECGVGNANDGIAFLSSYITANPNTNYTPGAIGYFYIYLLPGSWDANSNLITLINTLNSPISRTYFVITTTLSTYQIYTNLQKSVIALIDAPKLGQYPANILTAISYSGGVVTGATTTNHGVVPGEWFQIAGCLPAGYNGWWLAQPGTTGQTLIYNSPTALGAETALGTLVANYVSYAGVGAQEFSAAAAFQVSIHYNLSSTNKMTPYNYSFLFDVTPFPTRNNSGLLTTLQAANINVVGTGAEGGLTNTILWGGNTLDGNPFEYWYSVDWLPINCDLAIANAVINGSNDPVNPLYYNQDGINRLQKVAASVVNQGVAYGLILFPAIQTQLSPNALTLAIDNETYDGYSIVNAVPFPLYSQQNPSDYRIGKYAGISIVYTPARGFTNIYINIIATNLVSA